LESAKKKDEEAGYWKSYLGNNSGITTLPFANPKNAAAISKDNGKRTHVFSINESLYNDIDQFSKNNKTTIANILYSTWALLLGKFNQGNIVFGTTVSCRPQTMVGVENTVGLFINTIPMVCDLRPDMELRKILQDNQVGSPGTELEFAL